MHFKDQTSRDYVLEIYPDAKIREVHFYENMPTFEVFQSSKTVWDQILGTSLRGSNAAWDDAWKTIQRRMLRKLEE